MTLTFHNTLLAYLLSLRDYSQSLTPQDKENFKEFANEFRTREDTVKYSEVKNFLTESLIEKIAKNYQLNKLFQTYKDKLDNSGEIPSELLPKLENLIQLETIVQKNFVRIKRGGIFNIEDDTTPEGQELILHNYVLLILESEETENITDNLTWIDQLKKWLS